MNNVAIKANVIKVGSGVSLDHVILLAEKEIDIGSDVEITHAVLASGLNNGEGLLKLGGSDLVVGGPCGPTVNVAAYSTGKLTLQSNSTYSNVDIATSYSKDELDLQSNNDFVGVAVQSTGRINLGSDNVFSGCPDQGGGGVVTGPAGGSYVRLVK